jgi:formamidopyrimidine-DNA glycosylase
VPELPDVTVYVERLRALVGGQELLGVRLGNPFVVRTYDPPLEAVRGQRVVGVRRLGKRVVLELDDELFVVIHLMIAGRLRFREVGATLPKKVGHAVFDFPNGALVFTEASTQKRASIHVVRGSAALAEHDRGGVEPLEVDRAGFGEALVRERRTLKRALTDPRIFSGIGNAYSDEMLFWAKLSPVKLTTSLSDEEVDRLYVACRQTLTEWTRLLAAEVGEGFPDKVTAFREEMAVHGRYGQPCRVCGTRVQRIRYAANEVNYCPECQTEGKLLADRSLSRLLRGDWPRSLEELEEQNERRRG